MNCNPNNPCMGVYGKCLDVKITNICNGGCQFCIERDGLQPEEAPVERLIEATNTLMDYRKVLILGGEPFLYPDLSEYIEGIKKKDEIYITTNGSCFSDDILHRISKHLTAINISIHHFDEKENSRIIKTKAGFEPIRSSITLMKDYGVKIRINTNLVKGGIDAKDKAYMMVMFAKLMGADAIRFAELQNCPELFVSAAGIFDGIHKNPFCDGCEQALKSIIDGIEVRVRLTCGIVNPLRPLPVDTKRSGSEGKVLYPDAMSRNGWAKDDCHKTSDGCHDIRVRG